MANYGDEAVSAWQQAFLRKHQLGAAYLEAAQQWFAPLAARLAAHQKVAARPVLFGLNGSQGSGKTTLVDYLRQSLERDHGLRCATLSLDDFYLTRAARRVLAESVHPLFATRGVPGTHDNALMLRTLRQALSPQTGELAVPRFDKARDDRCPEVDWERVELPLDVVLFEGWCLGVEAQPPESLARPVNALERDEDPAGSWRKHVNAVLARDFPSIYQLVDQWVMLQAPSFDCVLRWRQEQEDKLRRRLGPEGLEKTMDAAAVARFVQYYQRLTEVALATLPPRVDYLYILDEQRQVLREGVDARR